ncbi:hypothetical protein O6H91_22G058600 [Diphasiastrum complanatum]|uniref:Uncharacterized protein n=1 Tax=Diphasiastrum complanatum TaxID=34168 RepID=A0ACC2AG44_DIPCM|nr:hypothetical protein O6H91_22G058600 [Diphasiastrum complanatum]
MLPAVANESEVNRAIVQQSFGGEAVDVLQLVLKKKKPKASPGHVVVRLTCRNVMPYDFTLIRDCHLEPTKEHGPIEFESVRRSDEDRDLGPVVGLEACGVVHEVGAGVTKLKLGQRVIPNLLWKYLFPKGEGAWQDYVEVAEDDIIPCPDGISDAIASQLLLNECAFYGALLDLKIPKGQWLLQTAANSNFGRQVIQLAKHWGIKTINLIRRGELADDLKALGADEVINYTTEDVVEKVKKITGGKRVYAAMDAVTGTLTKTVAACVQNEGQLFIVGEISGSDVLISTEDLIRGVSVSYWKVESVIMAERRDQVIKDVVRLLEDKVVIPIFWKNFELTQFKEAFKEVQNPKRCGRVLLANRKCTVAQCSSRERKIAKLTWKQPQREQAFKERAIARLHLSFE